MRVVRALSFLALAVGIACLALVRWWPAEACGPFFPSSLLVEGDSGVLQAPSVSFRRELARLALPAPPRLTYVASTGESQRPRTLDAEITDLRFALGSAGRNSNEIADTVLRFSRLRADLEDYVEGVRQWHWVKENGVRSSEATNAPRPKLSLGETPAEVPREFALYLQGAAAWHEGREEEARAAWKKVLDLPAAERRYKSTWAAFMLGRSWHDTEPARAAGFYDQAIRFARSQFSDTAGLGVAALGWQGQLRLRTNDLKGALTLYLDQFAAGDTNSAALSLTVAARAVTRASREQQLVIARDPVFRRVITAWLLASDQWLLAWDEEPRTKTRGAERTWLEVLEEVGAGEVPLAEQLALLAYQSGEWDEARRWIDMAGDSAVAGWVRAKLLLREGKLTEAAQELSGVVARLPLDPPPRERGEPAEFVDSLYLPEFELDSITGRRQVLGELGMVRLTRGEFVPALDALLRAGFWQDAAHVAERVLQVDELKAYVDAQWPVLKGEAAKAEATEPDSPHSPRIQRERIRFLLARRLTRLHRGQQATAYYPTRLQPTQQQFLALLRGGEDASRPARDRARSWFGAAWMARTNGLELLATELSPDAAIYDGDYEADPDSDARVTSTNRIVRPTPAEVERIRASTPEPNQRFHYRYQAAALAWEAARLLPNNDPETALMLYHGGSWLKYRDPKTADVFYKALVRRCRKTELGAEADRQRWFPELDEQGRPVPKPARPVVAREPEQ